jgi:hypothetical protein
MNPFIKESIMTRKLVKSNPFANFTVASAKPDFTDAKPIVTAESVSVASIEPSKKESSAEPCFIIEVGFLYKDNEIVSDISNLSQEAISELLWVHFPNCIYAIQQQGQSLKRYNDAVEKKAMYPSSHQEMLAKLNDQLAEQAVDLFKDIEPQGFYQLTPNIRLCNRTKAEKKEVVMPTLQSISSLIK